MLSHWNCLLLFGICSMFPKGNGSEYDKNCCHEKKQRYTRENMEKLKIQRTENGGKGRETAEKGGKTAEKDGLWTLRSKSCRKHAQKVVSRILSLLVFFLPWNFVESCNPSDSMSMKANASNVQLWTHIYCIYCIYSRACFLHWFSCSAHYIGKS